MKPKRQRLVLLITGLAILAVAVGLVLSALDEGVAFFYSPSDLAEKSPPRDRAIRIGGLVEEGSVRRSSGVEVEFGVTDLAETVAVSYAGILPDLFREGQGVVVLGRIQEDGSFAASEVLAKHDETYMPAEVKEALEASGQWKGENAE